MSIVGPLSNGTPGYCLPYYNGNYDFGPDINSLTYTYNGGSSCTISGFPDWMVITATIYGDNAVPYEVDLSAPGTTTSVTIIGPNTSGDVGGDFAWFAYPSANTP